METQATETKKELLSEAIDFNNIYRVKGKKGLYFPLSKPNKGNLVGMANLTNHEDRFTSNTSTLICLGHLVIHKNDKTHITLGVAFDNLKEHFENNKELSDKDVCSVICPDYDDELFKPYHAKSIVEWFHTINKFVEDNSK